MHAKCHVTRKTCWPSVDILCGRPPSFTLHCATLTPRPSTFWTKNWHTAYRCPGERSFQFFFCTFLFMS